LFQENSLVYNCSTVSSSTSFKDAIAEGSVISFTDAVAKKLIQNGRMNIKMEILSKEILPAEPPTDTTDTTDTTEQTNSTDPKEGSDENERAILGISESSFSDSDTSEVSEMPQQNYNSCVVS